MFFRYSTWCSSHWDNRLCSCYWRIFSRRLWIPPESPFWNHRIWGGVFLSGWSKNQSTGCTSWVCAVMDEIQGASDNPQLQLAGSLWSMGWWERTTCHAFHWRWGETTGDCNVWEHEQTGCPAAAVDTTTKCSSELVIFVLQKFVIAAVLWELLLDLGAMNEFRNCFVCHSESYYVFEYNIQCNIML